MRRRPRVVPTKAALLSAGERDGAGNLGRFHGQRLTGHLRAQVVFPITDREGKCRLPRRRQVAAGVRRQQAAADVESLGGFTGSDAEGDGARVGRHLQMACAAQVGPGGLGAPGFARRGGDRPGAVAGCQHELAGAGGGDIEDRVIGRNDLARLASGPGNAFHRHSEAWRIESGAGGRNARSVARPGHGHQIAHGQIGKSEALGQAACRQFEHIDGDTASVEAGKIADRHMPSVWRYRQRLRIADLGGEASGRLPGGPVARRIAADAAVECRGEQGAVGVRGQPITGRLEAVGEQWAAVARNQREHRGAGRAGRNGFGRLEPDQPFDIARGNRDRAQCPATGRVEEIQARAARRPSQAASHHDLAAIG
jgi:hypothetical protein